VERVERPGLALEEHAVRVREGEGRGRAELLGRGGEGALDRHEAVGLEAEGLGVSHGEVSEKR
jgi:hypothetical protein